MSAAMKLTKAMPVALKTVMTHTTTPKCVIIRAIFVKLPQRRVNLQQVGTQRTAGAALTQAMEATQRTATVAMSKGPPLPSRTIKSSN